jgi:hypothetical protein
VTLARFGKDKTKANRFPFIFARDIKKECHEATTASGIHDLSRTESVYERNKSTTRRPTSPVLYSQIIPSKPSLDCLQLNGPRLYNN